MVNCLNFKVKFLMVSLVFLITPVVDVQAGAGYGRSKNSGFGYMNGFRRFPRRMHSHLERKAERRADAWERRELHRGVDHLSDQRVSQCALMVAVVCLPVVGTYWLVQNANTPLLNSNTAGNFVKN